MTALYFRAGGRRYQLRLEHTEVMGKVAWVMEREGSYSTGEGQHRARHCRVASPNVEGLGGLLLLATTDRIW